MYIHREHSGSLKVELTAQELQQFHLTYEQLNYEDKRTKAMLKNILDGAAQITGFENGSGKLLIEVFPAPQNGCTVYFTRLAGAAKRYRQKMPKIYTFESCEALMSAIETLPAPSGNTPSELYELEGRYILILHETAKTRLLEYATASNGTRFNLAYIREHGRLLASPHAVVTMHKASHPSSS